MILAQAATHANSFYREWGLIYAAIAMCAVLLPGLGWLFRMKMPPTITEALTKIHSVLAGLFQQTVVQESRKIFRLIQEHLPYSLSQVDSIHPQTSAFDKLCQELRELDEHNPDRDHYRKGLERALSGVIVDEVEKLLQIAEAHSTGDVEERANPTGLRVSFEGETEQKLTLIAEKTVRANRMERTLYRTKTWTFRLFATTAAAAALVIPWPFVDAQWAFLTIVVLLLVFVGAFVAGILGLVRFHNCQQWVEETARRYRVPEDWMGELARTRTK